MASFTLACESDFFVAGMQRGEEFVTPVRFVSTLVAVTITSSWASWRKLERLSLFFAHWLSGLVLGLGHMVEDVMVSVCWTSSNLESFIKTMKFIELAASNMLAITNLAICVNLALIVMGASDFINVSTFYVEFVVGICMFFIVSWLALFRMKEIKECWVLHRRIRFCFGLTLVGTAVNLGLGICGTANVLEPDALLLIWSWIFRYIHNTLDTMVLYGVLRERSMDERANDARTRSSGSSSEQQASSGHGLRRGS